MVIVCFYFSPDLSGYLSMAQNHHHLQHLFDESNRFVLKLYFLAL